MACNLTKNRGLQCNDSVGGIDYVEFADFGSITGVTYDVTDTDVITALAGDITWFKYELDSNINTYVETITASRDNGTVYFDQVLTLQLAKLTAEDHKELKLLTYNRVYVKVVTRNGDSFIMGLDYGATVNGGSITTGAAFGDASGYNLTLQAMGKTPAPFYTGA